MLLQMLCHSFPALLPACPIVKDWVFNLLELYLAFNISQELEYIISQTPSHFKTL